MRGLRLLPTTVVVACVAVAAVAVTGARAATPGPDAGLALVLSYQAPPGDPAAAAVADRGWTYDSAATSAGQALQGRYRDARRLLDVLARLQHADGSLDFSYHLRSGAGDGVQRSGAVAWVGLAAVQYRQVTASPRYDGLAEGIARWLLARRVTGSGPGAGLVRGGPDVGWVSTEHNLEARALLAAVAEGNGPLAGHAGAATADLDAAIERDLLVHAPGDLHFRQGLADDARPLDAQALGALWLRGQGRPAEARQVLRAVDATMLTTAPGPGGSLLTGYKPFADAWGPEVLWTEGALQVRMARATLGMDTRAIDESVARLDITSGMLPQADRTVIGNQAGDYHTWPAAAPTAWLALSHSGSDLLG